ncbi:peptidoglycan DD-metalloendopeptidase family protein [Bacillus sp. 1P06AnD]|uniref:LysM peptidoglycan-binding domain-containing M23 family metallopeptidase n=1 Tax=Bacillus sp. 1P06AnD TaxID=3132208 RepID=UPI0039A235E6
MAIRKKSTMNGIGKALLFTTAFFGLSLQSAASADGITDLKTIYHVYNHDQYIGDIDSKDKAELDHILEQKLESAKKQNPERVFEIDQDISFIPEEVFSDQVLAPSVLEQLKTDVEIEMIAHAIKLNNIPALYVSTQKEAEQLLYQYLLQYVDKDELVQFHQNEKSQTDPSSQESHISAIHFSKDLVVEEEPVKPDQIIQVKQGLDLLNSTERKEIDYIVKPGDTLPGIAETYGTTAKGLLGWNKKSKGDMDLSEGDTVKVMTTNPLLEVTVDREVVRQTPIPYQREVQMTDRLYRNEIKVQQAGKSGIKKTRYLIKQVNGKQVFQETLSEHVAQQPVTEKVLKGTKNKPSVGTGKLVRPTIGGYISSETGYRWGKMHKGIDIARPTDRTIKAADNGVVVFAGVNGGYGNKIEIDHGNGMKTVYAHLASIDVAKGQIVAAGSKIGIMGSTGDSTGIHLHFEVYQNGKLMNPLSYLN